jgi:hypothetical protein
MYRTNQKALFEIERTHDSDYRPSAVGAWVCREIARCDNCKGHRQNCRVFPRRRRSRDLRLRSDAKVISVLASPVTQVRLPSTTGVLTAPRRPHER